MDSDNYVKYYKKIVPDDLCSKMCNYDFNYEASTYSTHASGKVLKEDRVNMNECWIRKNNWFYESIKECFENVIVKYKADSLCLKLAKQLTFVSLAMTRAGLCLTMLIIFTTVMGMSGDIHKYQHCYISMMIMRAASLLLEGRHFRQRKVLL